MLICYKHGSISKLWGWSRKINRNLSIVRALHICNILTICICKNTRKVILIWTLHWVEDRGSLLLEEEKEQLPAPWTLHWVWVWDHLLLENRQECWESPTLEAKGHRTCLNKRPEQEVKNPTPNIYIYINLNHFTVHLKITQHYKSTIFQ